MSVEQMTRNLCNAVLILRDKEQTGMRTLRIPVEVGNLKWTETVDAKQVNNRKELLPFMPGRDVPMDVSFTIGFVTYMGAPDDSDTPSPVDVFNHVNNAAVWENTEDWGVHCIDLEFRLESPNEDLSEHEIIVFRNFHKEKLEPEEDEDFSKIAVSGKCRATVPETSRLSAAEWDALTY